MHTSQFWRAAIVPIGASGWRFLTVMVLVVIWSQATAQAVLIFTADDASTGNGAFNDFGGPSQYRAMVRWVDNLVFLDDPGPTTVPPATASGSTANPTGSAVISGSGIADQGQGFATATKTGTLSTLVATSVASRQTDVIITQLSGSPVSTISTSANISLLMTANGGGIGASIFEIHGNFQTAAGSANKTVFSQQYTLGNLSTVYTTPSVTLPVGQAFDLTIAPAVQVGQPDRSASILAHFGGSPVFNLPANFTANSSDGLIVDNFWMGTPIPEPSTWLLASLALAGLGLFGSRARSLARRSSMRTK